MAEAVSNIGKGILFMTINRTSMALVSIFTLALTMPACSTMAQQSTSAAPSAPKENTRLTVAKGQYLSIIMPDAKSDADANAIRQTYYQQALPLGASFGLKRETQMKVDKAVISDYKPSGLIFFSYPDQASEKQLTAQPNWPAIKALRPQVWNELRIYSAAIEKGLDLNFDPAKYYTLVVAWTNPENPDDYQRYLTGIENEVRNAGGRFIYKMHNPKMEAHATDLKAPSQLTFVEWDAPGGFPKVQATADYKASAPYFQSGLTKFEFYEMSVNGKTQ